MPDFDSQEIAETAPVASPEVNIREVSPVSTTESELQELRCSLGSEPRQISPKYFYDERGSQLFERICAQPEYYQTRTERAILAAIAPKLAAMGFEELLEYGSGSSAKTRTLIETMTRDGGLRRYLPLDVSREMLVATARDLCQTYPDLDVEALVGDFHSAAIPPPSRQRLTIFLGGTIGNFDDEEADRFLRSVADDLGSDDSFLLGIDLVKDPTILHAAYNDAGGVTREFNLNLLSCLNDRFGGDFDPKQFFHYSFYSPRESRIEMHLVARTDLAVRLEQADLDFELFEGESIRTEISRKFTRRGVESMLGNAGLSLIDWFSDDRDWFALALARKIRG